MSQQIIGSGFIGSRFLRFETDSGLNLDPVFMTGGSATFEWIDPEGNVFTGATPNPALGNTPGVFTVKCSDWTDVTQFDCTDDNVIALSNLHLFSDATVLDCKDNSLTALGTTGLNAIQILRCQRNSIAALNVAALITLTTLTCDTNAIGSLAVAALVSLTSLICDDNGMNETNVDKILADLVIAGASNGVLDISGTNAAPSVAGDANVTTLVARGWTVTTS